MRNRAPALARRFDGIAGLERAGAELRIRVPAVGWALRERERQEREVKEVWNHVVFWVWEGRRASALAVRKTHYREA